VFDLIPFAGAGRVVGDDDVQPSCCGESCEFVFPEPESVSVGSAAVGGDEDSAGVGVFLFAHVLPPLVDRGDGEHCGVVVDAYGDPGAVIGQVVDSIGNGFAVGLFGEVIGGHLDRFTLGMPFPASLSELSDEFFLFLYQR